MARPKQLWEMPTQNAAKKEYFQSTYSLSKKVGGDGGLKIGQDIYCLPLIQDGFYQFYCHAVKPKKNNKGFKKNMYTCYIPCKSIDESTGENTYEEACCQLASEEWKKYEAAGKKNYETKISFTSLRTYLPVLLLGNDSGSKATLQVPITKLNMSGRDYSFIEFSKKGFEEVINNFKNYAVNNGLLEYGLEGAELQMALSTLLQQHILKISIQKPDVAGFAKHKKIFSFIPFTNKAIGAETGAYKQITLGLQHPKIQGEITDFLDKFSTELDNILVDWTTEELVNYVNDTAEEDAEEAVAQQTAVPKAQQVVEMNESDFDLDMSEIPTQQPVQTAPVQTATVAARTVAQPAVNPAAPPQEIDELDFDDDLDLGDGMDVDNDFSTPVLGANPAPATVAANQISADDDLFSMGDDEDFFGGDI